MIRPQTISETIKMAILVYEVPEKHEHRIEPNVRTAASFLDESVRAANNLRDAETELGKKDISLVIVHEEGNFSDVRQLKTINSKPEYVGYSGTLRSAIANSDDGNFGKEIVDGFIDNYDYLAHDLVHSFTSIITAHKKSRNERYHR